MKAVCHRTRGIGADGVVVLLRSRKKAPFELRMFNPDGGEFERSGNGLRIVASYLRRAGRVTDAPFEVVVGGDTLGVTVHGVSGPAYDVSVAMGRAVVGPGAIGLDAAVLDRSGRIVGPDGSRLRVVPVSVGNPHLVSFVPELGDDLLETLGPFLSSHPALSAGANVQLVAPIDRGRLRVAIWERGVGRTSASGTSACAVAAAAVSGGQADAGDVTVDMAGGSLDVSVTGELDIVLRGPVEEVCEGVLTAEASGDR